MECYFHRSTLTYNTHAREGQSKASRMEFQTIFLSFFLVATALAYFWGCKSSSSSSSFPFFFLYFGYFFFLFMTSSIRPTLPLGSGGLERARSSYYSNFKRKTLWPNSEANSFQQPVNALAYGLAVGKRKS